jgi:hypothetical protein
MSFWHCKGRNRIAVPNVVDSSPHDFMTRCVVIAPRSIERANESRVLRSMQEYLDGEQSCNRSWILGVIGADIPLANRLLLTRFARYRQAQRFRDLQATPIRQTLQINCECGEHYAIEFQIFLGLSAGLHFFLCSQCQRRQATSGEVVNASRWDELSGKWTRVAANSAR